MNELEHLSDSIHRAYAGEAWHGPSIKEALDGLSFREATVRRGDLHTIWELTVHVRAWLDAIRGRLENGQVSDQEVDWPPVPEPTKANWETSVRELAEASDRLCETVRRFPASRLDETVRGRDHSFAVMLHGAAQHVVYHAGQISLIRRLIHES